MQFNEQKLLNDERSCEIYLKLSTLDADSNK